MFDYFIWDVSLKIWISNIQMCDGKIDVIHHLHVTHRTHQIGEDIEKKKNWLEFDSETKTCNLCQHNIRRNEREEDVVEEGRERKREKTKTMKMKSSIFKFYFGSRFSICVLQPFSIILWTKCQLSIFISSSIHFKRIHLMDMDYGTNLFD